MHRLLTGVLACALLHAAATLAQDAFVVPGSNLKIEGIPPIPISLARKISLYTEFKPKSVAAWHPVNREMLVATRADNTVQLHRLAEPGGRLVQLTDFADPVRGGSYEPKRGAYIVYGKDAGGSEATQVYRLDPVSGKSTLLTDPSLLHARGEWDHAGERFVMASTQLDKTGRREQTTAEIALVNPAGSGAIQKVASLPGTWGGFRFSPDDKRMLLVRYTSNVISELWEMTLATGERRRLFPVSGDSRAEYSHPAYTPDGKAVLLASNAEGEFDQLLHHDLATGATRSLTRDLPFDFDQVAVSRKTGAVTRWTETKVDGIDTGRFREAEAISWPSFDGLKITGFIFRPPAAHMGKRPVMINIHGGPEAQARPSFLGRNNYFINDVGVAMIYPNVRGSSGFGKTFLTLDDGVKREDSVKDIGALLDWIAKDPGLDPSRVLVMGGSYGGYMSLAVSVHYPDRIAGAIDVVGISNFLSFLERTESYRRDLRRAEYGDERDPAMRAFLENISPLTNAHKIAKPLFVIQGRNDPRVPWQEADQIVTRARLNKIPVWYLLAEDEGHGFAKKNNADFAFYAMIRFAEEVLLKAM